MQGNRPNTVNVGRAVCSRGNSVNFLGHGAAAGDKQLMADGHWHRFYNRTTSKQTRPVEQVVKCAQMRNIMKNLQVPYLNFWSLDCEGCEETAVQTFDFQAVPVQYMIVELDTHDPGRNQRIVDMLQRNGIDRVPCDLVDTGCFSNAFFPDEFTRSVAVEDFRRLLRNSKLASYDSTR
eukprot:CAMPEP_0118929936 /NCGR_PEP_ID=MMETSP1169-20130426/6790_1 /TAXON_ID=36882 /ORGANISM="Pyramimonas obovata, Strain CCMP722" /LENGTH=177 /DNA_ID=CAMNT_0006872213 /DNA_START=528 /DNA_END=1061 /DNA_ORIENTATION=+